MKLGKLASLVRQNVRRNRKNMAFSAVGLVVGISSFFFFISLGDGIKRVVSTEIFPVDTNRIQVVAPTAQFGSLSSGRRLDDKALASIRGIEGVKDLYPRMKLAFLASTAIDGRDLSPGALALLKNVPGIDPSRIQALRSVRMWLEIMGDGIDPRLVSSEVMAGEFKDPAPGDPIPVLLSDRMVEIYNGSFAEARGMPKISAQLIPFIPPFPLTLNHSFISRDTRGTRLKTQMKLVGLSRHAIMGGITVPLETARKYNRQFVGPQAAETYDAVIVEVRSSDFLGPVQEEVRKLGFDIDLREKRLAESVGLTVLIITLLFTLISLIIVGIAAVNIAHTFFMIIFERKRELGLMRALGATRADIRRMILGEATLIGITGGLFGLGLGLVACLLVDTLAASFLPDFPFKPESFFAYPPWLFFASVLFAVVFCWLGAIVPAHRAARMDPARALTGR